MCKAAPPGPLTKGPLLGSTQGPVPHEFCTEKVMRPLVALMTGMVRLRLVLALK